MFVGVVGRIALGFADVHIISIGRGEVVAAALREAGFGVTQTYGQGREKPAGIVQTIVPRKNVSAVVRIAGEVDAKAIVSVSEIKAVQRGYWQPVVRR